MKEVTVDDLVRMIGKLYIENQALRESAAPPGFWPPHRASTEQEVSAAQNGKPTIHEVLEAAESA